MQNATAAHDACRLANRATAVPSAFRAPRGAKDLRRIAPLAARPRAAAVAVVFAAGARAARGRDAGGRRMNRCRAVAQAGRSTSMRRGFAPTFRYGSTRAMRFTARAEVSRCVPASRRPSWAGANRNRRRSTR
ncbi:hypothetical protein DIS09_28170 [Burkholderia pseudomallei]|nr:hypothetical protein DIS09_28170 [Burkholderia pseudomallei]